MEVSMAFRDLSLANPRIPILSPFPWTDLHRPPPPTTLLRPLPRKTLLSAAPSSSAIRAALPLFGRPPSTRPNPTLASAGRSKKKPGGPSPGRIEGNAEVRRQAKIAARKRSRRLAENLFYRHNNPKGNQADQFSEEELQMIGLGYDRTVRFMDKDDPSLRHPHDWYKYGQYGPYSWRGIVIGRPIRGRFSDERVTLISEVRDHEEWEKIEQFDMTSEYGDRVKAMDASEGLRYFWVFVRHPKWNAADLPWQQWTLVAEVALEAGRRQRLDKWSLMGRLGNKARAMITQCAAWMRPDIIYVKRPVYQCRFEPQDDFFRLLGPLLDPETEGEYLFELKDEEGRAVEMCTYFAGLCKIVKVNEKAFVDDVVRAYQKLSDEGKSRCLEFLLTNHPTEMLHPYTKEWKAKLEEMELGCDSPDESDDEVNGNKEVLDWIEVDNEEEEEEEIDDGYSEDEDEVLDVMGDVSDVEGGTEEEEEVDPEESREYWNDQWNKAVKDSGAMERLVTRKVKAAGEFYKKQRMNEGRNREMIEAQEKDAFMITEGMASVMEEMQKEVENDEVEEKVAESGEAWESIGYRPGPKRKVKKSKIPPELFLRAAVRPFTYRNLVKEIVLMRHAIIDQEINAQA